MAKYNTYIVTDGGERIEFTLDSAQRKNFTLAINGGRLTVRVPKKFDHKKVREFIQSNLDWIRKNLDLSAEKSGLPRRFEDGERIRLLGKPAVISLVECERYFPPEIKDGRLIVSVYPGLPANYAMRKISEFIAELANKEIAESMERLTKLMGLYPNKVTIKSLSASWGRCSSEGNISINYKVITYPKSHIDYVCIHELAHLVHMDHSPEFWSLVEKYCPDWRRIRESMK